MGYMNRIGQIATGVLTLSSAPQVATVNGRRLSGVHTIEIHAEGGNCYYGDKDVTTATGFPILKGETKILPVNRNRADLYLVGTGNIRIAVYTE